MQATLYYLLRKRWYYRAWLIDEMKLKILWNGNECGKTKVMRIWRKPSPIQIMTDQTQLHNVVYLNYLGTCEIKSRTAMAKAAINKWKIHFTSKTDWNLRKTLAECYTWSIALYSDETWTLQKAGQKHLESFKCCWRRMEKISWSDDVKRVLRNIKEERNIPHTLKRRKVNRTGHILSSNCLLKHITAGKLEGRMEMIGRWGRRNRPLEMRGYWEVKEEALDHAVWETRFGRG